jgi:hypothetical protein
MIVWDIHAKFTELGPETSKDRHEVKHIANGCYMCKLESKWSPQKKKAVKVSGEYIGVVTPSGHPQKRHGARRENLPQL